MPYWAGCALISAALVIGLTVVPAQSLAIVGVIMLWAASRLRSIRWVWRCWGSASSGGDIARANTAFSLIYVWAGWSAGRLPARRWMRSGEPGLGWTLGFFYVVATVGALLAMRRRG